MYVPANKVLLVLNGLAKRLAQYHLCKVLQFGVDVSPDGVSEDCLHASHEHLQALNHGDHLNQSELLLFSVVVTSGL